MSLRLIVSYLRGQMISMPSDHIFRDLCSLLGKIVSRLFRMVERTSHGQVSPEFSRTIFIYLCFFMINPTYALSYLGERKTTYLKNGILVLENFLSPEAFSSIFTESVQLAPQRYRSTSQYNVYIKPNDPTFPPESPRNRVFRSSK